ncbi:envelope biogenesis factor ElyC [Desulfococcaceae bacterium HSG8]|nr:envelope biogenesis factor ElyC [Desulfococcaceae bacterium HSG8]
MFLFKKIISLFIYPMPLCFGISFAGLYLLWFTKKQRLGKILISTGICALFLMSSGPVSYFILRPLEKKCPPCRVESSVKFIVVLGGGHVFNPKLPVSSQLNPYSLARLLEGIRLHRKNPQTRLIVTGRGCSVLMADVARSVGVKNIIIDSGSKDTKDEAKNVKRIVRDAPFVLITSAAHMPRAVALFRKQGMNPCPYPSGHLIRGDQWLGADLLYPNSDALYKTERAIHEYLGLIWAKLREQI